MPGITYPRVPGHEVAGTVDAVADGVFAFKAGDRVGIGWHGGHCGVCDACRHGEFIGCPNKLTCGISFDGGYGEYLIAPVAGLARIPDELDAVEAAPLMCAGLTTFNALRHCGIRPGDVVAVQGIGGLGHLGIQFARRLGARVVAISRGDDKRALALELGAHEYVDGESADAAAALRTMGGARVILATAPNAQAIAALAGGLGLDGTLMIVAAPGEPIPVSALTLISTRGSVRGWASGTPADSEDTMRVAVLEGIRPTIETFPLSRAEEAYRRMMSSDVRFRAVLIPD
jgi:D-arabinose 1-dehydrogenase-like Zn-dependent alcohol dehydrogenase